MKCQIVAGGKLTAWCAQHDEKDYSPKEGRAFELASINGSESVGIVELLMNLDKPSPEVVKSVDAAVAWFKVVQIPGIRVEEQPVKDSKKGKDRVVVKDASAPPMWARFYEIGTNRAFFCDRDGVPKYSLSEIGYERRNGYRWLNYWPQKLLAETYPAWKQKLSGQTK